MITVDESGENMITVAPGANREVGTPDVTAAVAADVLVIGAEIPAAAISAALAGDGRPGHDPALRILNLAPAPSRAEELLAARPDWLVVERVRGRDGAGGESLVSSPPALRRGSWPLSAPGMLCHRGCRRRGVLRDRYP
jgi:hypothetical protein